MSVSRIPPMAALGLALAAYAGGAAAAGGACELSVYAKDTDPNGLNVRSGPSIHAAVVATLPGWDPPQPDDELEGHLPALFTVVEARNGWVRIADVRIPDAKTGTHRASAIQGWVSGRMVGYSLQTEVGFQRPDPASPALIQHDGGVILDDAIGISGCSGEWARIDYGDPRSPQRAWFRGLCGRIETTCDGRNGDESEEGTGTGS